MCGIWSSVGERGEKGFEGGKFVASLSFFILYYCGIIKDTGLTAEVDAMG